MVWVNLLPWRAQQLRVRLHRWYLALLVLLAAFFTALLPIAGQQAVNTQQIRIVLRLQEGNLQVNELKSRTAVRNQQREWLERQLAARRQRQQRMGLWVDFTSRLAEQLPETLWLSELTKTPEQLTLSGFCLAMADVHDFRRRLQQSPLFSQVTTGKLSRSRAGLIQFSLQAVLNKIEGDEVISAADQTLKGEG